MRGVRLRDMKTILIIIMAVVVGTTAWAADVKPCPSEVVVTNLTVVLPEAEDARPQFLWDQFANKPEVTRFEVYGTQDWKRNYRLFAATLVSKAKQQDLPFESLAGVLEKIKRSAGALAYLPVGAYQATLAGQPVWIVVVKWENAEANALLGHVRIFAFDQKTLAKVGFETCW